MKFYNVAFGEINARDNDATKDFGSPQISVSLLQDFHRGPLYMQKTCLVTEKLGHSEWFPTKKFKIPFTPRNMPLTKSSISSGFFQTIDLTNSFTAIVRTSASFEEEMMKSTPSSKFEVLACQRSSQCNLVNKRIFLQ